MALTAALLALGVAAPAAARVSISAGEPDPTAPTVAQIEVPTQPVDLGVVAAPLRFEAGPGIALELADGRRYLDTLELRSPGDDQVLVNDVTVEDYVAGVAEMPGRWHLEALKAQAVAARTYAWYQAELGTFAGRGYDICDTVACQAFAGASQQEDDHGDRWREAVDATAGEVLLDDDGDPILARYFSTSGGRTQPNEAVFPDSGPRPYLRGIDDPEDAVSPYHRWEVVFTREEFETILARGEQLAEVVPVASVERLGDIDEPGVDVRVTGQDGTEVVLPSGDLRRFVSDTAAAVFPDRFPTRRSDGFRDLPSTLPSSRFTVEVGEDEVRVTGHGWGHAVGMGQYGARGRAEAGASYVEILAAYYAGLTPTTTDRLPERFRVGLSHATVGSVTPDAAMRIVADGEVVAEHAAGTWTVATEGEGVRLSGPPGWGEAAAVSRTEPAVGVPSLPRAIGVEVTTAVPGRLALRVEDAGGELVVEEALGSAPAGRQVAVWDGTGADGTEVAPGTYRVALTVTAADGSTAGHALPVAVEAEDGVVTTLTGGGPRTGPVLLVAFVVVSALGVAAFRVTSPGRRTRTAPSADSRSADPRSADPRSADPRPRTRPGTGPEGTDPRSSG